MDGKSPITNNEHISTLADFISQTTTIAPEIEVLTDWTLNLNILTASLLSSILQVDHLAKKWCSSHHFHGPTTYVAQ